MKTTFYEPHYEVKEYSHIGQINQDQLNKLESYLKEMKISSASTIVAAMRASQHYYTTVAMDGDTKNPYTIIRGSISSSKEQDKIQAKIELVSVSVVSSGHWWQWRKPDNSKTIEWYERYSFLQRKVFTMYQAE